MRPLAILLGASILIAPLPAFAQDAPEAEPSTSDPPEAAPSRVPEPAPAPAPAPETVPEAPKPAATTLRDEGMRLALELSFWRANGEESARVNAGSPSLIPLGADVSWRTSRKVLLGFHGHAALASRDDCLGDTDCTGRGYGLGAHIEAAFGSSASFIPYFRYGLGWEMVHQMGAYKNSDAYRYRHALDLLDVRFGGDFVVSRGEAGRTTRIGPFVGMIVGLSVDEVSSGRGPEPEHGAGHIWFSIGLRGTSDW